jgi:hypothetical protein
VIDDRPLAEVLTLHPEHEPELDVVALDQPIVAAEPVAEEIYALAPDPVSRTTVSSEPMPEPSSAAMPAPSAAPLAAPLPKPMSPHAGEPTDTAALLRELTSLGLNDAAQ